MSPVNQIKKISYMCLIFKSNAYIQNNKSKKVRKQNNLIESCLSIGRLVGNAHSLDYGLRHSFLKTKHNINLH